MIPQYSLSRRWILVVIATAGFVCGELAWGINTYTASELNNSRTLSDLYKQAATSPIRTNEDKRADTSRKPMEFLQFTQVRPGMRVLDIATGNGYTTQLLALVTGSTGTVWAQGEQQKPAFIQRLTDHPQPNIVSVTRPFEDPIPNDVSKLDLITNIMNYHNGSHISVARRVRLNQRLFKALKSGGYLIVIDHSTQVGTDIASAKRLHRMDQAIVLDEIQKAGFRLEQENNFLRNPSDPRNQAYFDMKIPTDKFAFRFVKP
ncbi:MAG: putative methyltransferase [Candidatus Nitrotoga sp. SPKER]|nr:MAG: putative methyltransferase [Candidatus Nitrotoga sp. SPKER]